MQWFRNLYFNVKDFLIDFYKRDWPEVRYDLYKIRSDFFYPFYRTWRQFWVFCSYIPVLWQDRDWDWVYLLKIIQHKLKRMETAIRNGSHSNCTQDANQIRSALKILSRMIKQNYDITAYNKWQKKWGKTKLKFEPLDNEKFVTSSTTNSKVKTPKDEEQSRKELKELLIASEKKEQSDHNEFFGILAKKLRNWWD